MQCGHVYSVGGTTDNDLLYWGLRYKTPPLPKFDDSMNSMSVSEVESHRGHSRMPSTASVNSTKSAGGDKEGKPTKTIPFLIQDIVISKECMTYVFCLSYLESHIILF